MIRVGIGCDTHALAEGRKLILGGIEIPHDKGLLGHSDADALIHAIIDALFGASALGDIGSHYPDTSDKYKDISSVSLLEDANELLKEKGYRIVNIDSIIIAQKPKMAPFIPLMQEKIASVLSIDKEFVSIKAKTNEKLGFIGKEEGIETRAVALIEKI